MSVETLTMLHKRLAPLSTPKMPLSVPPPRKSRFGGPLALSKVHWVRPELVAETTHLGWKDEPLLRHTVFVELREVDGTKRDDGADFKTAGALQAVAPSKGSRIHDIAYRALTVTPIS